MTSNDNEVRRVLLAQTGDRQALDQLFRDVQQPLYRCLRALLGSDDLAEDALQEVLVLIFRKIGDLREPRVFRPWSYRIATRYAQRLMAHEKRWRKDTRESDALELREALRPEEPDPDILRLLPEWVAAVSPASRVVLVLHYLEELALKEVSDVLGISLGTVKSRLGYGLSSLRRLAQQDETR